VSHTLVVLAMLVTGLKIWTGTSCCNANLRLTASVPSHW